MQKPSPLEMQKKIGRLTLPTYLRTIFTLSIHANLKQPIPNSMKVDSPEQTPAGSLLAEYSSYLDCDYCIISSCKCSVFLHCRPNTHIRIFYWYDN